MNEVFVKELEDTIAILRKAQTFQIVTDSGTINFKGETANKVIRETLLALFEANLLDAKR